MSKIRSKMRVGGSLGKLLGKQKKNIKVEEK